MCSDLTHYICAVLANGRQGRHAYPQIRMHTRYIWLVSGALGKRALVHRPGGAECPAQSMNMKSLFSGTTTCLPWPSAPLPGFGRTTTTASDLTSSARTHAPPCNARLPLGDSNLRFDES